MRSTLAKYLVRLLRHADEGRALRQLAQPPCANVGARRAYAAKNLFDRSAHGAAVGNQHFLAFGRTVFRDAARVSVHREAAAHPVEPLELLPFALDDIASRLVVAGEHAPHHHEIRATAKSLRHVPGGRAATVGANVALEAMRRVRAFDDRRELR